MRTVSHPIRIRPDPRRTVSDSMRVIPDAIRSDCTHKTVGPQGLEALAIEYLRRSS